MDLIVKNATLQDGSTGIDIACSNGMIVAVEPNIDAEAGEIIDASGRLVVPPFVDAHWHLDAALLHGDPYVCETGLLYEGINAWLELKAEATVASYKERMRQALAWAVANGLLHIRCQTDICDLQLRQVQALVELRDELRDLIDLQLVAFPQDGYLRDPNARSLMTRALDMGLDVVGGIPDYELTAEIGFESVKQLCELANERNLMVDMHVDQTPDPNSRQIEAVAHQAIRLGMGARVSASHCVSMKNFADYYADKLIAQIAQAEMNVCVQPMTAATCWGVMTRVNELYDAGVNVAFGQDSVMDPWFPFGKCDMLDVAHMAIVYGRLMSEKKKARVFDSITYGGARALQVEGYGIANNMNADMVVLQAADPMEAIRIRATRLAVIRRGKVIARQNEQRASVMLGDRTIEIDFTREGVKRSGGLSVQRAGCGHGH
ncbi:cytosine deaminase [Roseitalea porphyridii]|uniref:cytosine deaminase n=1 Tax=Roseitalea porphyridii TaxID=1852022 RepID=UPI001FCE5BF4|nr:cytosine deaminase [Roseitalea porphyridii]